MHKLNVTERSLYMRSMSNMLDILERMHLDMHGRELTPEADKHYRTGVARFHQAMVLITKSVLYKTGKRVDVPFVIHTPGDA